MDEALNQAYQNFYNFIGQLQFQDGQELRKLLRDNFLPSLEEFNRKWLQCNLMTRMSYVDLRRQINDITQEQNTWFYIGYTNDLSDYLWTTEPKSADVRDNIINPQQLVKTHTYYTHLEGVEGQNEHNLINMVVQNGAIIDHDRCLNRARNGIHDPNGIVYCLVYEPQQP